MRTPAQSFPRGFPGPDGHRFHPRVSTGQCMERVPLLWLVCALAPRFQPAPVADGTPLCILLSNSYEGSGGKTGWLEIAQKSPLNTENQRVSSSDSDLWWPLLTLPQTPQLVYISTIRWTPLMGGHSLDRISLQFQNFSGHLPRNSSLRHELNLPPSCTTPPLPAPQPQHRQKLSYILLAWRAGQQTMWRVFLLP